MKIVMVGGHHTSALPVIAELNKQFDNLEITWFGHKHSLKGDQNETLEYKEITQLGIPFITLESGKVYRNLSLNNLLKILSATLFCINTLLKLKPEVVMSFGGYLAVPVVVAAWLLGIKIITHEQTLVSGYANRFISLFADMVLISWEQSQIFFAKEKTHFTGIPLREEIFNNSGSFDFDNDLPTILIMGGKTGSHTLNLAIKEVITELLGKYNLIHQTGDNSVYDDYSEAIKISRSGSEFKGNYSVHKFILLDKVGSAFKKADVVVCRSGAHTALELLVLKKKAVLIPIPWVSHNEQMLNARLVEESGLGIILEERNLSADSLKKAIETAMANSARVKTDHTHNYPKDAASRIVGQIRLVLKSDLR